MIYEHAEIDIKPGHEDAFEAGAREARKHFLGAPGCVSFLMTRSVEHPNRYRLFVEWASIEAHMEDFRNSEAFLEWRRLVGPHFVSPPRVEHLTIIKP